MFGRHAAGTAVGRPIELRIGRVEQLFDVMDPAPFWEKDLDRNAAEFIELSYREAPPPKPRQIRIRLPAPVAASDQDVVQRAVAAHFARSRDAERLRLKEHNRRSRLLLVAALAIMAACFALRSLLVHWLGEAHVPTVLAEGLIVLGWVALWRPLEELMFEWHPLWRRVQLYDRLSGLSVALQADDRSPESPSTSAR